MSITTLEEASATLRQKDSSLKDSFKTLENKKIDDELYEMKKEYISELLKEGLEYKKNSKITV